MRSPRFVMVTVTSLGLAIALALVSQRTFGEPSADNAALEQRVVLLEQRVTQLEQQLSASQQSRPERASAADRGVPAAVRAALEELHPDGQVVESGRETDDGYWWFEVRRDGQLFDVEISNAGQILANRPTDD